MEILAKYLKLLTNEVSELNRRSSEAFIGSKLFKLPFMKKNNNNQLAKSAQSSNVLYNVESLGMDNFCTFHQERHLEKTCPQWNHNLNTMVTNFVEFFSKRAV